MNPTRASDLANYAYFITTPGADRVIGTWDDGSIAISSVVYNAALRQAVLPLAGGQVLGEIDHGTEMNILPSWVLLRASL